MSTKLGDGAQWPKDIHQWPGNDAQSSGIHLLWYDPAHGAPHEAT
ncbi:hypothetical protein SNOG_16255 [Parastagonospora nodorum SN15]|uniref:Uncharacterized protein n=1 Tax=Phaeosphaeria nodorum (strain SN15 / ATCC MYA-4574 / FGSC 10173) TaxID=321614 RepID=Q0TWD0_PHANO|nr:hypothetical protein SNOG_16255 [Parastagonospora nodorum SN15]EAT76439.1 hypothetical protein SNOG_16255 [Parastagonospora nodorum SN15]